MAEVVYNTDVLIISQLEPSARGQEEKEWFPWFWSITAHGTAAP